MPGIGQASIKRPAGANQTIDSTRLETSSNILRQADKPRPTINNNKEFYDSPTSFFDSKLIFYISFRMLFISKSNYK